MHKLPCFYTLSSFKEHEKLKEKVLKEINNSKVSSLVKDNDYYTDNINRVDWNQCTNFKRPWVQYLLQPLMAHIETEFNDIGYLTTMVYQIWFQQYFKEGTHGWHIHGHNFTGVYYLDFDQSSPKTELVYPYKNNEKISINANEGDVVIFPSFVIHRGPKVLNDKTKTIISFNFSLKEITKEKMKELNEL